MLKLYHGTNMGFDKIELSKCLPYKDFGKGFYLTTIRRQAMERAINKCNLEGFGTPTVLTYLFDENELNNLNIKHFDSTNEDWARFIIENRNRQKSKKHNFDVVIGPVADDGVIASVFLYETHVIDMKTLIERLKFAHPNIQYAFCTEKAIALLKRI